MEKEPEIKEPVQPPGIEAGEAVVVKIEKLVDSGAGLGRVDGRVVFVPRTLPGETVEARVTTVKKGYAEALPEKILTASPNRVEPPCPVFGSCGGCQWQHIAYHAQLEEKVNILREDLARIGKISDANVLPPIPAPEPYEYRTRIQLKTDLSKKPPEIGFYESGSHRIVPFDRCLIAAPAINEAVWKIRSVLTEFKNGPKYITEVHVHQSGARGKLLLRIIGMNAPREAVNRLFDEFEREIPDLVSQVYYGRSGQRFIRKRDYLLEEYKGVRFRISDRSFAQVNWRQTGPLVETLLEFAALTESESVLELYSGIGTFGLFLAGGAKEMDGFDEDPHAVKDAVYNTAQKGLSRCRFERKPAIEAVRDLLKGKRSFDCVVLDPPREGVNRSVLKSIRKFRPSRIVYVSCHPASLARDLRILAESGWRVGRIQPIDLFPQTHHLEVIAEILR
jgi:23S rRNA (uracil1939-C5)-methyltransferase